MRPTKPSNPESTRKVTFRDPKSILTHKQQAQITDAVNGVRTGKLILFKQEAFAIDLQVSTSQTRSCAQASMLVDLLGYEKYLGLKKDSHVSDIEGFVLSVVNDLLTSSNVNLTDEQITSLKSDLAAKICATDLPTSMKVSSVWTKIFGVVNFKETTYGELLFGVQLFTYGEKATSKTRYAAVTKQGIVLARRYFFVREDKISQISDELTHEMPEIVLIYTYNPTSGRYDFLAIEESAPMIEFEGSIVTRFDSATAEATKKMLAMIENYGSIVAKHFPGLEIGQIRMSNLNAIAMAWDAWIASINGHRNVVAAIQTGARTIKQTLKTVKQVVKTDWSQDGDAEVAPIARELAMASSGAPSATPFSSH